MVGESSSARLYLLLCAAAPAACGLLACRPQMELVVPPGWALAAGKRETLPASLPERDRDTLVGWGTWGHCLAQFTAEQAQVSPGQGQAPGASRELVIPSVPKPHLLSWSPVISINPSCPD